MDCFERLGGGVGRLMLLADTTKVAGEEWYRTSVTVEERDGGRMGTGGWDVILAIEGPPYSKLRTGTRSGCFGAASLGMGSNPSFTSPLFRFVGILFFLHYIYCSHLLLYDYGPTIGLYQGLWICSLSLLLAGLGLILGYPKLVSTSLVAVATGHFLWTIDSIYMLYNWDIGKTIFDIGDYGGVGRQVTFATVWTNLHHIWFMPICIYYLRSIGRKLTPSDLHCSVVWICFISAATACVVPMECVEYDHPVHGRRCMSLNVNMIRKFWGLEGSKFMHSLDR